MHPQGFWVLSLFLGAVTTTTGAAVSGSSVLRCGAARASRGCCAAQEGILQGAGAGGGGSGGAGPGAALAGRGVRRPGDTAVPSLPSSRELPCWLLLAPPAVRPRWQLCRYHERSRQELLPIVSTHPTSIPAACGAQPCGVSPRRSVGLRSQGRLSFPPRLPQDVSVQLPSAGGAAAAPAR